MDSVSPKKAKSDRRRHTSSSKSHRSGSSELSDLGQIDGVSPLTAFLTPTLPPCVTIKDPSLEVLALLRVLHGLNRHWSTLYDVCFCTVYRLLQDSFVFIYEVKNCREAVPRNSASELYGVRKFSVPKFRCVRLDDGTNLFHFSETEQTAAAQHYHYARNFCEWHEIRPGLNSSDEC